MVDQVYLVHLVCLVDFSSFMGVRPCILAFGMGTQPPIFIEQEISHAFDGPWPKPMSFAPNVSNPLYSAFRKFKSSGCRVRPAILQFRKLLSTMTSLQRLTS